MTAQGGDQGRINPSKEREYRFAFGQPVEDHEHHWHLHYGPWWGIIPAGHVVEHCCRCEATRTVHRDHRQ